LGPLKILVIFGKTYFEIPGIIWFTSLICIKLLRKGEV